VSDYRGARDGSTTNLATTYPFDAPAEHLRVFNFLQMIRSNDGVESISVSGPVLLDGECHVLQICSHLRCGLAGCLQVAVGVQHTQTTIHFATQAVVLEGLPNG
jgi:hypothetical protein